MIHKHTTCDYSYSLSNIINTLYLVVISIIAAPHPIAQGERPIDLMHFHSITFGSDGLEMLQRGGGEHL
jgi:hypothetical protein